MDEFSTKEKIMDVAIKLFSDRGYDRVSMRDIAGMVGIKASSIYNHFSSKREILKGLYDFYAREFMLIAPKLETALHDLETEPLRDVLTKRTTYYWSPLIQDRMDRIILIASQRICLDQDSEIFIREHFFEPLMRVWISLLTRGIEMGKVAPVDAGSFAKMITYYAFSAAELNRTSIKVTYEEWINGLDMLFSLLEPKKIEKQ